MLQKRFLTGFAKALPNLNTKDKLDTIMKDVEATEGLDGIKWYKTVAAERWEGMDVRPKLFKGVASSTHLDRHKEVMIPQGSRFQDFLANPTLMDKHDHTLSPLGRIVALGITKDYIVDLFYFHGKTDRSREEQRLYEDHDQTAFSIGFVPCCGGVHVVDKETDSVDLSLANGSKINVDFKSYDEKPWAIHYDWILLEKSCVVVGSNPAALLLGAMEKEASFIRTKIAEDFPEDKKDLVLDSFNKSFEEIEKVVVAFEKKYFGDTIVVDEKVAVEKHTTTVDDDSDAIWKENEAKALLRRWASAEDGEGKKEDIDFSKYALGFAGFDSEKISNFTSYWFLHHTVKDGDLITSQKALWHVMFKLLELAKKDEEGEAPESSEKVVIDLRDIYEHIANHFKDAEMPLPEFKRNYSDEDLASIKAGSFESEEEPPDQEDEKQPNIFAKEVLDTLGDIGPKLTSFIKASDLMVEKLEELGIDIGAIKINTDVIQSDVSLLKQGKLVSEHAEGSNGDSDPSKMKLEGEDITKMCKNFEDLGIVLQSAGE